MSIATVRQDISIDGVTDIQVSEAVDMGDGTFKRAVRVYGPLVNGAQADPIFTIYLVGPNKASIDITTPVLTF